MLILPFQTMAGTIIKKSKMPEIDRKIYIYLPSKRSLIQNGNIEQCDIDTLEKYKDFIVNNDIDCVVVLSFGFASAGLVNYFKYNLGIPTVGVTKYWTKLESSKLFAKKFMINHNIPTPDYMTISNLKDLEFAISKFKLPLVIKYDGLCGGFGSYICDTKNDCIKTVKKLLKKSKFCLAEKYINGEEATLHLIWDGNSLVPFELVRDFKKSQDGNKGINTGSMGSYMPVKISENKRELVNKFVEKLKDVFNEIKPDFKGIFVCGLMITENECYNLEFNMRPGMPEFEVILAHCKTDIFDIFTHIANGTCSKIKIEYKDGVTGCVNVVHKDYLKEKNKRLKIKLEKDIHLLEEKDFFINTGIKAFDKNNFAIIEASVPVLSIIKRDSDNPFPSIYSYLNNINNKDLYYRKDLGAEL